MTNATTATEIISGVIGVGGAIVGGPVLRLVRWSDWKTSFLDALNVSLGSALVVAAYLHLALRFEAARLPFSHVDRSDRILYSTLTVTMVALVAGFALLRRHRLLRSTLTALLVMFAIVCAGVLFLFSFKR